jgi:uncharacterized protein YegJ (DUF2314 family)
MAFYTVFVLRIRRFVTLIPFFLAVSCEKAPSWFPFPLFGASPPGEHARGTGRRDSLSCSGGDPTFHAAIYDEKLDEIALRARDTLPFFFSHLRRPAIGEKNFAVKYSFRADDGSGFAREQLWLGDIRAGTKTYTGVLLNTPFYVSGLSQGDRIDFDAGEITDWMFTRKGKIVEGRSIRYFLEQIPAGERSAEQQAVLGMFE